MKHDFFLTPVGAVVKQLVDFWCRRPTVWRTFFKGGLCLLGLSVGTGIAFNIKISDGVRQLSVAVDTAGGVPAIITGTLFLLGVFFLLLSAGMLIYDYMAEVKSNGRKRVIVVEQRGLKVTPDTPLAEAVPRSIKGGRISVLNDLRQRVANDYITEPQTAFDKVMRLPEAIQQHFAGQNGADVTVVYGGISPVPLTFLTGFLLDDETPATLLDWDRDAKRWRELDGTDDGDRFQVYGLDSVPEHSPEVILAVSASYKVDIPAVRKSKGDLPLVHLDLPQSSTSSNWSETKQQALARAFRETLERLEGLHVGHVHLFITAPNSLVFRLGQAYDKRLLPPATIYQYERSEAPPHPWGVTVPTHGVTAALIRNVG